MISARRTLEYAVVIVAAGALLLGMTARSPAQTAPMLRRGMLVLVQDKVRVTLNVEIADTPESREVGLMNRPSLPDDAGMLFVFESTSLWAFWMKDTLIPLSVAFIDDQWKIVDIQDMRVGPNPQTGRLDIYEAAHPSRYAVEVNQGLFVRRGIGVGAKVIPAFKLKSQEVPIDWDRADREIKRLPPSAFATLLPAQVIKELDARGCTIPQTFASIGPHNVIRGQFASSGQFDWAVMCSVQRISSILVFWGGPARCASEFGSSEFGSGPDKNGLQGIGGSRVGYSLMLGVADRKYIGERNPNLGFAVDHEGIEVIFLNKASVVHYCHQEKWSPVVING